MGPVSLPGLRVLIGLALAWALALPASAAVDKWSVERAKVRKQREELRQEAVADRSKRAAKAAEVIAALLDTAGKSRVPDQDACLDQMLTALARLDAAQAAPLRERLRALPPPPDKSAASEIGNWQREVDRRRKAMLTRTGDLLNKAVEMRLTDLAYEFLQEILAFDPDRAPLRKQLGQTERDGVWYGKRDLEKVSAGLAWDGRFGWILSKEAARYEQGEYYEPAGKKWTTLAAANQRHASMKDPWILHTEHIEIRGSNDLEPLVKAATRLEQFYAQIFAAYASFFTTDKNDYKLILGIMDHPRLVVTIFRDAPEYHAALPDAPEWSAGLFSPAQGGSFFYGDINEVMYHEFTHQILHVFTGTNQAPAWLTEGIAVYTQGPTFEDGQLVLGRISGNSHLRGYFRAAKAGRQLPLGSLLMLESGAEWAASADPGRNYQAAGAVVQFCMEGGDRAYRADFVDFLKDSYRGLTGGRTLWDYLGLTRAGFESAFDAWVAQELAR